MKYKHITESKHGDQKAKSNQAIIHIYETE